jgi:ribosome-binding protein aMBF1 (putative translation factor)
MTVQFLEIAGQRVAVLPAADYERLVEAAEDRADEATAASARDRREKGEEYLPSSFVDQLLAGANPLKAWREFRGLSQAELADAAGCHQAMVSHIEQGRRTGTAPLLRRLADVLRISVDDLVATQ